MTLIRWRPLRNVTTWDPATDVVGDFSDFRHDMERMFDRFSYGGISDDGLASTWLPPVDIIEHDNEFAVNVELPGVKKEDVKITLKDDVLTIHGEKKQEKETEDKNCHRSERVYGSFQRSFTLPASVKSDKIEASYNHGILTITLPKAEESKPKEIEVKVK